MKRALNVAMLGFVVLGLLGGCETQLVTDSDHLAPFGSIEVFYELHNADPAAGPERTPLVFVHGWACDHQYWKGQIEGMPHDRAMLVIDLPGYGLSPDGGAEHTMDFYADAVIAAMADAGIERAVLLGHSMGTPVIRQFERRNPARTTGLVAVDGALRPFRTPEQLKEFVAPLYTDQWREFAVQMFDAISATMAHEKDRAHVREVMLNTTQRSMQGGFAAMNADDIWTEDPIETPLLLTLTEAPFWNEEYKSFVRSLAPGVRIEMFADASHFLMMDQPEKFNRVVLEWLEHNGL